MKVNQSYRQSYDSAPLLAAAQHALGSLVHVDLKGKTLSVRVNHSTPYEWGGLVERIDKKEAPVRKKAPKRKEVKKNGTDRD